MKLLHIADPHLGLKYNYIDNREKRDILIASRSNALKKAVDTANDEKCDVIVVAGDLFDNMRVSQKLVKEVCEILNEFTGEAVLVMPGNHDYYNKDADNRFWDYFEEVEGDKISLMKSNEPKELIIDGEAVRFYPCLCHDKHSDDNALGWLKDYKFDENYINVGIAHGSIEGLSYDKEKQYYSMTLKELDNISVDAWLIGHAHVPKPYSEPDKLIENTKIFNAGTHQQTDVSNNTEGSVFIVNIDTKHKVTAKRLITGQIKFVVKEFKISPEESIQEIVDNGLKDVSLENTVLRVILSGTASTWEYENTEKVRKNIENKALYLDKFDVTSLNKEITLEMIDQETVKGSIENKLLKKYTDNPKLLSLAFDLIRECKED